MTNSLRLLTAAVLVLAAASGAGADDSPDHPGKLTTQDPPPSSLELQLSNKMISSYQMGAVPQTNEPQHQIIYYSTVMINAR